MASLSMAKIDKYYNLRAKYQSTMQDYSLNPNTTTVWQKEQAKQDLLLFCLETVADMAGDFEFGSCRREGLDIYG